MRPGEGAWANYDFKPGERILFADDFSRDEVGDFPRRLTLKEGSMEVVEWQGRRLLRATGGNNRFLVTLPEDLPQRYTLEFDYANAHGYGWGGLMVGFDGKDPVYSGSTRLRCNHDNAGIDGREVKALKAPAGKLEEKIFRCRLMVDGDYAKVYVNEQRTANVPNAALARGRTLWFTIHARDAEKHPALIGDIRIAAGGKQLYDGIAEKGRVATQGIYFDVGSDRIRPESTPTLKEIAAMLTEHAELKLAIEGHTDASGQAAANLTLSERRAAAVKQALVAQFGVEAARLESKGLGQTKPAAPNDTPEGRQQNRRVELVRL
jgi:outer membrane protein OmpA-like peptidoglycan-associated protein